jgi:hypothetical protein
VSLTYPLALLGLLSIPTIFIIHALYQKKKRQEVSTLFLIREISPYSPHGIRLKQLVQNPSLWLQVLALCLAIWLALGARWVQEDHLKKVAVVIDSSASMLAFYEKIPNNLEEVLSELDLGNDQIEWHLLSSHLEDPLLYKGNQLNQLYQRLSKKCFFRGVHDKQPALDAARRLVEESGEVIFFTDYEVKLKGRNHLVSLGEKIENVGFAGASVRQNLEGQWEWNVLIQNPNFKSVQREFRQINHAAQKIALKPNQVQSYKGPFPSDQDWIQFSLNHDGYRLDDELTLIKPSLKKCMVYLDESLNEISRLKKELKAIYGNSSFVNRDVAQLAIEQETIMGAGLHRVCFYKPKFKVKSSPLSCMGQNHVLVKNLSWQKLSMMLSQLGSAQIIQGDRVLVWHESHPLIFLRQVYDEEKGELLKELHCNFPYSSDFWDAPAFSVLFYRFVLSVLKEVPGRESKNVSLPAVIKFKPKVKSKIELIWDGKEVEEVLLKNTETYLIPIQSNKKTLEIKSGKETISRYAFQSVDAREGDFSNAETKILLQPKSIDVNKRTINHDDPYIPIWIFLMGSALIVDWSLRRRRS